ncbi:RNA exonuclease 4 [Amyelois transitella]|uniref:RNA exonuclease 4 n=1 Tax=Amyelois transitella TaxID=680683 RepID=UPI00067D8D75|nr:RNA exonuclease 4 [Amyelois transitella]
MEECQVFGLDVEMVEVEPNYKKSAARVSLVSQDLKWYYDKYVRQDRRVLCYKKPITGLTKEILLGGKLLKNVRRDVLKLLRDSVVVGHSIHYDFDVLQIDGDDLDDIDCIVRDTTEFSFFRKVRADGSTPSLKELARHFLGKNIQQGVHCSVVDAATVVQLYTKYERAWEREIDLEY